MTDSPRANKATPKTNSIQDLTLAPEWGTGEHLYLYFAVRDTGRGLNTDERNRLFNRFSQASPKTHVQYGGSGLGLFISRELTELQAGEIGVASNAGEGSTFASNIKGRRSACVQGDTLARPAYISSRAWSATELSAAFQTTLPTTDLDTPMGNPRTMHKHHTLLVEDNLINQKILSKQLRNISCTVYVANQGTEALDFLQTSTLWTDDSPTNEDRNELSVIFMDLETPIMDGLICTRRIRDLEREGKLKCHVPIIAVTANARSEQIDRANEAGMDDIVPKPFRIPDLIRKTDRLLAADP